MLRRCLQLHLSLIVLADQTPRKAWPFRPPPGDGFGLDGDPVSEGLLLMDVSLIVAERGVQIVARHSTRTATPRASRSRMPRWPRSPSSVTLSTASGITPSHPTSSHLEAVILRRALTVGLLGIPVVIAILLQSSVLHDQAKPKAKEAGPGGRELLLSRPMLLFFAFFLL